MTTQISLGAQPQLLIAWEVDWEQWNSGFKLLGFRNSKSFASEQTPQNLSVHGDLILEEAQDGERYEILPEGSYFYTFLLRKKGWLGNKVSDPLRFSVEIPSARTILSRLKDRRDLEAMQLDAELAPSEAEIKRNETVARLHRSKKKLGELTEPTSEEDPVEAAVRKEVEPIIRRVMVQLRTRIELQMQLAIVTDTLKLHPGWKKLKKEQREKIMNDIAAAFDEDEATWKP